MRGSRSRRPSRSPSPGSPTATARYSTTAGGLMPRLAVHASRSNGPETEPGRTSHRWTVILRQLQRIHPRSWRASASARWFRRRSPSPFASVDDRLRATCQRRASRHALNSKPGLDLDGTRVSGNRKGSMLRTCSLGARTTVSSRCAESTARDGGRESRSPDLGIPGTVQPAGRRDNSRVTTAAAAVRPLDQRRFVLRRRPGGRTRCAEFPARTCRAPGSLLLGRWVVLRHYRYEYRQRFALQL